MLCRDVYLSTQKITGQDVGALRDLCLGLGDRLHVGIWKMRTKLRIIEELQGYSWKHTQGTVGGKYYNFQIMNACSRVKMNQEL